MSDPYISMELFNLGISMEQPATATPEALNVDKTIELVIASNDFAFDLFKKDYISQMRQDPMMMPVLISCIPHDWQWVSSLSCSMLHLSELVKLTFTLAGLSAAANFSVSTL